MGTVTELKAGRELDALVAEKVMGWVPGAGFERDTYWAFSTDIGQAWLVVERLATDGWSYQIMGNKLGAYVVKFTRGDRDEGLIVSEPRPAPLAICLAALRAAAEA